MLSRRRKFQVSDLWLPWTVRQIEKSTLLACLEIPTVFASRTLLTCTYRFRHGNEILQSFAVSAFDWHNSSVRCSDDQVRGDVRREFDFRRELSCRTWSLHRQQSELVETFQPLTSLPHRKLHAPREFRRNFHTRSGPRPSSPWSPINSIRLVLLEPDKFPFKLSSADSHSRFPSSSPLTRSREKLWTKENLLCEAARGEREKFLFWKMFN